MLRLKAEIAYDGTAFCGWQIQKNQPTIQAALESCLQHVCGNPVGVTGAGRTDSGVHAYGQVAHFDWNHALPSEKLILAMNALLPPAIRVLSLQESAPDFHARFDAKSKIYLYRIDRNRIESPFSNLYALHYSYPLELDLMRNCAAIIPGEHDFAAFQATGTDVITTTRTCYSMELIETAGPPVWPLPFAEGPHYNFLYLRIHATGFLRKMVRFIVGTLLEIGSGKRPADHLSLALSTMRREYVGVPAPARGLFLERVLY